MQTSVSMELTRNKHMRNMFPGGQGLNQWSLGAPFKNEIIKVYTDSKVARKLYINPRNSTAQKEIHSQHK